MSSTVQSTSKEAFETMISRLRESPQVEACLLQLCEATHHKDAYIRRNAARLLGRLADPDSVPDLLRLLNDSNERVRGEAARSFAEFSPPILDALPGLYQALQDPSAWVRCSAAFCLGAMGPSASDAVPLLLANLNDRKVRVLHATIKALGEIGSIKALPALSKLLRTQSWMAEKIIPAIGRLGPPAKRVIPLLLRDLRHGKAYNIKTIQALQNLGWSEGDRREAALALTQNSALRPLREDYFSWELLDDIRALGSIGHTQATQELLIWYQEVPPSVHVTIYKAFLRLGPHAEAAIPLLRLQLLQQEKTDAAPHNAEFFGTILGHIGEAARPTLEQALEQENPEVLCGALLGLGYLGSAAPPLLKRIAHLLAHTEAAVGRRAAQALGRIREESSIPALLGALQGDDPKVIAAAAHALGQMRPQNPTILAALRPLFLQQSSEAFASWHLEVGLAYWRQSSKNLLPFRAWLALSDKATRELQGDWKPLRAREACQLLADVGEALSNASDTAFEHPPQVDDPTSPHHPTRQLEERIRTIQKLQKLEFFEEFEEEKQRLSHVVQQFLACQQLLQHGEVIHQWQQQLEDALFQFH